MKHSRLIDGIFSKRNQIQAKMSLYLKLKVIQKYIRIKYKKKILNQDVVLYKIIINVEIVLYLYDH